MRDMRQRLAAGEPAVDFGALEMLAGVTCAHARIRRTRSLTNYKPSFQEYVAADSPRNCSLFFGKHSGFRMTAKLHRPTTMVHFPVKWQQKATIESGSTANADRTVCLSLR
jgi:hypothetical protein